MYMVKHLAGLNIVEAYFQTESEARAVFATSGAAGLYKYNPVTMYLELVEVR